MKNINMRRMLQNVGLLLLFVFVWCEGQGEEDYSVAPMEEREQEALYSAIQGFVGNWWNGSDLYPDPCGWTPIQGVSCDLYNGFWYVSVINIGPVYDNSLKCTHNAAFTHHLFDLRRLRSLSFYNCFLFPSQNPARIPNSGWENLSNTLESLEFRSNPGLIGTIPATIGCLNKLQSLVLIENGLMGALPEEIGNLVHLRKLVLAGNQFSGQIPASFGGLSELLIFDSSRNNISGPLRITFGGWTSLLKLDLSNNVLEGELPREIGNLRNLTLLDLSNNMFSGGLSQSLQKMCSLKEIVISNNPILGGDLEHIEWENLQNLEILDLSNMGLEGQIPESIAELKRLRFLGLSNNSLSGSLSPRLASLPCISSLYLNGNNLTGELEFSEWFYRKMGKRFGARNNPNLCFQAELMSTRYAPHGVKLCQQEMTISRTAISNANFTASLGFSSRVVDGTWWLLVVQEFVVVVLWKSVL